jgi:neutral ceramidase
MSLLAGAAVRDITPQKPLFLVGYPHVPRTSSGVHDPLLASALYLCDGVTPLLLVAADILYLSAESSKQCRFAISKATGIPWQNMVISATHTHSGPVTHSVLAWKDDPVVQPPDPEYLEQFHRGIIESAIAAYRAAEPARLAVTGAKAQGVGCNRLDPNGSFDSEVGLLAVQRQSDSRLMAVALIYGMHPTVLHEDSSLVSSDFPYFTRQHLNEVFPGLITLFHTGPCGNLSPRYHVQSQTFAEAERLGRLLGQTIAQSLQALSHSDFTAERVLAAAQTWAEVVPNAFPSVATAEAALHDARERYDQLKRTDAPHGPLRTAECFVFGCEETLTLARAQASGEVARLQHQMRRAEVQVFRIGDLFLAAWPGEQFVEYGLEIKHRAPGRSFVISLANGELQGYIVTPGAAAAGGYEAAFSLFRSESGERLVTATLNLMQRLLHDPVH